MSGDFYDPTQLRRQQMFYDNLSDEERAALARAQWLPERLASLNASSGAEQGRLQDQLDSAQRMVAAPIQAPQSSAAGVVVPTMLANALRTFGGAFIADKRGQELSDAQAKSAAEREALIRSGEAATGITKRAERNSIADALKSFGGGYGI